MVKNIIVLGIAFCLFLGHATAQTSKSEASIQENSPAVCVWQMTGMFELPGKDSPFLEKISLGQIVRFMTDSFFVQSERVMYRKVKSPAGGIGWVDRSRFVENATPITLIASSPIYATVGVATSITNQSFFAGEIAAMADFQEGWIYLIGQEKKKQGWVRWEKDQEIVSVSNDDMAIASLLQQAKKKEDPNERITSLEAIRQQPGFYGSPLNEVVMDEIEKSTPRGTQATESAYVPPAPESSGDLTATLSSASPYQPATSQPASGTLAALDDGVSTRGIADIKPSEDASQPEMVTLPTGEVVTKEKVYDTETGINYLKYTQTGSILPVAGPTGREDLYFAYHKTLPKGAKVLLNIPDNPGFVELVVINKLGEDRPQIVALHPKVIEAVFGANARNPQAQLIYFKRQ